MEKAKAAAQSFISKAGHHDTTVDERIAPAVTHETVNKQHHEERMAAIDREVHKDHYHTTVQPVKDREVLPEQHQHRVIPVEHREHHHGKDQAIKDSLAAEQAKFQDTRTQGKTTETHSTGAAVAGEHVHHHVHEVIQPVLQKETIQPSTVHTTVPIHEVHHKDPQHHSGTTLPAVNLDQFKAQGGTLTGRGEKHEHFSGEPRTTGATAGSVGLDNTSGTTGSHSSNVLNKADPRGLLI